MREEQQDLIERIRAANAALADLDEGMRKGRFLERFGRVYPERVDELVCGLRAFSLLDQAEYQQTDINAGVAAMALWTFRAQMLRRTAMVVALAGCTAGLALAFVKADGAFQSAVTLAV